MKTTKKQWIAPVISDLEIDTTQSGTNTFAVEGGERFS